MYSPAAVQMRIGVLWERIVGNGKITVLQFILCSSELLVENREESLRAWLFEDAQECFLGCVSTDIKYTHCT